MTQEDDSGTLDALLAEARAEAPPAELADRVLSHIQYRTRLEASTKIPRAAGRTALALAGLGLALAAAFALWSRGAARETPPIAAERVPASSTPSVANAATPASAPAQAAPLLDPCSERASAIGADPLIDDFEDGDDAVRPLEGRAGFWRWAREIDAPGTAPALIPLPRPEATRANRLALHVKGGQLLDWGATVEFNFRPACYDASKYIGITFQARGPGRIYVAPREVSVIPIAEGGTCDHDCHNPHVGKVDLDATWRTYQVRFADVRQRGMGKPPLDPQRLNSLAFLIRPEDTPYDIWLDDVRFIQR